MRVIKFLRDCPSFYQKEKKDREIKYDLFSHEENYEGTGKIYAKVRLKGTSRVFYKPISELYQKEWLKDFSKEDGAFIAVLYLSEQQNNPALIERFPRKKQNVTKHVVFLGMLFVSFLILSNLTALKIVECNLGLFGIEKIHFPAALIPEFVIWKMVATQYLFKVGYEILALPLTYVITGYLKSKDQIDYYDYKTSYNPFSMKVDD